MLVVNCQFQRANNQFDFQFSLPKGQCLLVSGESGGGKSTLLDVIAGFILSNDVQFNNHSWSKLPPDQRQCSLLMQKDNLFEHLSICQNIGLALKTNLKLSTENKQSIYQVAEQLEISDLLEKKPPQLSGGQNQRAALARSLIANRPLLLLDEPFAALAKPARVNALVLLQQLAKQQSWTVVLVSHQPEECRFMADYEVNIVDGKSHDFRKC